MNIATYSSAECHSLSRPGYAYDKQQRDTHHDAGIVMVLTIFMAAASGLGAVPYFFVRSFSKEYSALASAVACGVMLAASFDLVHEGQPYGANLVILGVLSGTPPCTADFDPLVPDVVMRA